MAIFGGALLIRGWKEYVEPRSGLRTSGMAAATRSNRLSAERAEVARSIAQGNLANEIPPHERLITVERALELAERTRGAPPRANAQRPAAGLRTCREPRQCRRHTSEAHP
jgi:hypothetical protein